MPTGITLKVVSFNVGGSPDLQITAEKFLDYKEKKVASIASEVFAAAKEVRDARFPDNEYRKLMETYISNLLSKENPDILCLQEMPTEKNLGQYEHAIIGTILKEKGYVLYLGGDAAIAYKKEKFETIKKDKTNDDSSPALFADLRVKENGSVVRVVSDHAAYQGGEASLKSNLDAVTLEPSLFEKVYKKIKSLFTITSSKSVTPDLIIYGLDANGTRRIPGEERKSPQESKEWNPDRIDYFTKKGYVTDEQDVNPTYQHFDPQTKMHYNMQKIDHIFVKGISCLVNSITSIVTEGLNHISDLESPKNLPASDHKPVIYEIKITTANETWTSLIKQFFRVS